MKTFVLAEHLKKGRLPKPMQFIATSNFIDSLLNTKKESLWISEEATPLKRIFRSLDEDFFKKQGVLRKHSKLFLIVDVQEKFHSAVENLFKDAIILSRRHALPFKELLQVLADRQAENYVIGGSVDESTHALTLIRGDLSRIVIPLSAFKPSGNGIKPRFSEFSVEDFGQTIKLGEYEASVDSVLYEFDSSYRKKRRAQLFRNDKSFGACLKRLRLQKGIRQSDFPDIDPREIGRIERGEVTPRKITKLKLAKKLRVAPDEIESY